MSAANTDSFIKVTQNKGWALGPGGIPDAVATNFALVSADDIPTDTAVLVTIDRVDANGKKTPTKMERMIGVVSGDSITDCIRGVAGTAQQHNAGAVVEVIVDAVLINKLMAGILVEHNQNGTHKSTVVSTPIHAASVKSPIIDADEMTFVDSAASWALKKITFAAFKLAVWAGFQPQEGFTLNCKIVPSAAASALTLAVKGKDGNDPSATNPVYVFLGGAMRSITSPLSLTIAQGTTNNMLAGLAEFSGKEIDLFAAFILDGSAVRLGTSRFAMGRKYGNWSNTAANQAYMYLSGGSPASTDPVAIIGRFAAICTFSTPNYNWTVPTYDADNLIQGPIYETRKLSMGTTYSGSGSLTFTSTSTEALSGYKIVGRNTQLWWHVVGTTGGVTSNEIRMTTGFTPALEGGGGYHVMNGNAVDSSSVAGWAYWIGSTIAFRRYDNGNWGLGAGRGFSLYASFNV